MFVEKFLCGLPERVTFVVFNAELLFGNRFLNQLFMSRAFALLVLFCLTFASAAQAAPGDNSKTANAGRPSDQIKQLRIERAATAQALTAELTKTLALAPGADAQQVASCVEHLLGTDTEAGYNENTVDIHSLDLFLVRCTDSLQRALAPVLSQRTYDQYVALLDARGVVAK